MDLFNHPPKFIKVLFPHIIWEIEPDGILITIDDGPSEDTGKILEVLDRYGIKAIFFCTGKNIEKYPANFQKIVNSGHLIGNHGYAHKQLLFSSKRIHDKSFKKTDDLIKNITGASAKLVRPPYGRFNHHTFKALKKLNKTMMLWSLLSGDHTGDFAHVRRLIDSYLHDRSIVVLHDNKKSKDIFAESIEYIVQTCKDRGITVKDPNSFKYD
ncbi:MAG: polysaccharide deacetylase family protein [Candidatus Delongbacteria bacterium]|nr:polysaccharide deacetylase family protein [Candidatus Delongbacteria bacterium]